MRSPDREWPSFFEKAAHVTTLSLFRDTDGISGFKTSALINIIHGRIINCASPVAIAILKKDQLLSLMTWDRLSTLRQEFARPRGSSSKQDFFNYLLDVVEECDRMVLISPSPQSSSNTLGLPRHEKEVAEVLSKLAQEAKPDDPFWDRRIIAERNFLQNMYDNLVGVLDKVDINLKNYLMNPDNHSLFQFVGLEGNWHISFIENRTLSIERLRESSREKFTITPGGEASYWKGVALDPQNPNTYQQTTFGLLSLTKPSTNQQTTLDKFRQLTAALTETICSPSHQPKAIQEFLTEVYQTLTSKWKTDEQEQIIATPQFGEIKLERVHYEKLGQGIKAQRVHAQSGNGKPVSCDQWYLWKNGSASAISNFADSRGAIERITGSIEVNTNGDIKSANPHFVLMAFRELTQYISSQPTTS